MLSKTSGIFWLIFVFLFVTTTMHAGFFYTDNNEKPTLSILKVSDLNFNSELTVSSVDIVKSDFITSNIDGGGQYGRYHSAYWVWIGVGLALLLLLILIIALAEVDDYYYY